MTPLSDKETRDLMRDIGALQAGVKSLNEWRKEVDCHDEKQDTALFNLETRASKLEFMFAQFIEDQLKATKRSERRQKIIIGLAGISGMDALGWNLWHRMAPFLSPYVSEQFFWFTIGTVGLAAALYALWNATMKKGK